VQAQYSEEGVAIPEEGGEGKEAKKNLLERMGLNGGAVRNVMMHRDLVPRAFACDYALVSDLLARVSDSFKNLESLRDPHRQVHFLIEFQVFFEFFITGELR
jgi:hypothetical protein